MLGTGELAVLEQAWTVAGSVGSQVWDLQAAEADCVTAVTMGTSSVLSAKYSFCFLQQIQGITPVKNLLPEAQVLTLLPPRFRRRHINLQGQSPWEKC